MQVVGASTFIQAKAERLGNHCQSSMMEKSSGSGGAIAANWNSEVGSVRGLSFGGAEPAAVQMAEVQNVRRRAETN